MRTTIAAPLIACLVGVAACGGDSATEPTDAPLATINGAWAFDLYKTATGCQSAIQGTLYANLAFAGTSPELTALTTWTNDSLVPNRFVLEGRFTPATGDVRLRLWTARERTGLEITGQFNGEAVFSGRGDDPIPGYQP